MEDTLGMEMSAQMYILALFFLSEVFRMLSSLQKLNLQSPLHSPALQAYKNDGHTRNGNVVTKCTFHIPVQC